MLTAEDFKEYASGRRKGLGGFVMRGMMLAASKLYGVGVRMRNRQYDRGSKPIEEAGVPVVSIGNITLGGTGKTPTAAWLARWFRRHDVRVTLISRGYGAERGELNDEARELDDLLPDVPHLQNPDRVAAAKVAVEELAAQVLLLDDAFQHRRIARNLDIVLIDATEPFGFGYLFPRGMLREPLDGLARADVLALTRADAVSAEERQRIHNEARQYNSKAIWIEMIHRPASLRNADGETSSLDQLQGKRVAAFCGIGNPAGFRHTISSCGAELVDLKPFPDHHIYKAADIATLEKWAAEQRVDCILCTHKDLVKVGVTRLGETPLVAIVIEAEVTVGLPELEERLTKLIAEIPPDEY
ncbi:tetraacyldisaccharide 4'-kinase [Blastopirellula sp. JC732]|uniref:Tetraacyldisaccharide 4'-kinase n=1 Tax=Blastopirellula sediminis TaxID=2894196 RepID=A0A9X1MS28_9BACT|nr:tetraacyldisaccharide 4'-kinase [Blastopirellula sediminis]MCC9605688.1 tetraacyldisaccharide 4'-kinase [Blastopirellula sediminis]MCC9631012.1 tetraacyldisaccharide 4'-kinase [Blastopirellula sediminis]